MYLRWKVAADPQSSEPGIVAQLVLEAILVRGGPTLDSLPPETKETLASGAAKTFFLFATTATWRGCSSRCGLYTTPGIFVKDDAAVPGPTDPVLRWKMGAVLEQTRRGCHTDGSDWEDYFASPVLFGSEGKVAVAFVVPLSDDPSFRPPTGKTVKNL